MSGFAGAAGKMGLTFSSSSGAVADGNRITFAVAGEMRDLQPLARALGRPIESERERLLGAAYERWKSGLVGHLRGRFAILMWDEETSEGFIAVDQLGAGSLFYAEAQGALVFATELHALLDALPSTPTPDELAVAQWIADGALERGRTLYRGIHRLQGGSRILIEGTRWSVDQYWSPTYEEPLVGSRAELAVELRDHVTAAVRRAIPEGGKIGTLVSGGLDSSVIAAVAPSVGESGAYSMTFPAHPTVDETHFIDVLVKRLRIPSRRVALYPSSLLEPASTFLRKWAWPSISPALFQNLEVARLAREDAVDVLLDGEGGDELFAAPPYLIADALRRGRVPTAIRLARQLASLGDDPPRRVVRWLLREYGFKGVAPKRLHDTVRRVRGVGAYALPWLNERTRRILETAETSWEWKSRPGPRWWAQRVDLLTSWRESLGAHDYLRRKSAMAGVLDAHPFLDDLDLAEFVLRLPPQHGFDANYTRPLLREAMRGLVPDDLLTRRDKATFNHFIEACLTGPDSSALVATIGAPDAEINAFVRPAVVRDMYLNASTGRRPDWIGVVWRLATIESWLRDARAL